MFLPFRPGLISLVLALALFSSTAKGQNFAGAEEQLAGKIVSAAGVKTMTVEVVNRSSLSATATDDIRRNLLTQLAVLGVRFVGADQAAVNLRVSFSENVQSYLWIAEIRQGADPYSVVMVSLPRTGPLSVEPRVNLITLNKTSLWSQPERILDVAIVDGNPPRILVLDANGVTTYRSQEGRWLPEPSQAVAHSRPWPRDLRGKLVVGKDKDHPLDVYLPGVHCRSPAISSPVLTCSDSDQPWPLATDSLSINAPFTPSRNYFSGSLVLAIGRISTAPAFYSAANVLREQSSRWLLAAVNGQVHVVDGVTDQVVDKADWGSDIASVRSSCGSGGQILATANGEGPRDTVRAFELTGRELVPVSESLEVNGAITALWTESGGVSAIAVVHNLETGRYEASRLALTCGR